MLYNYCGTFAACKGSVLRKRTLLTTFSLSPHHKATFRLGRLELVVTCGSLLLALGLWPVFSLVMLPIVVAGRNSTDYALGGLLMAALVEAMILVHETGHAVAFYSEGAQSVRITMRLSGGACASMVGIDDTPWRAMTRAIAGPVCTILGIIALFL